MPSHSEQRTFPYRPQQLFELVADVESYPDFLPWCRASRILRRDASGFDAELVICFKHICERYTSHVTLLPHSRIDVKLIKGPFEHLENRWQFAPGPDGGSLVDFHISFKFKSALLDGIIGSLFTKANMRLVEAFSRRADSLYG